MKSPEHPQSDLGLAEEPVENLDDSDFCTMCHNGGRCMVHGKGESVNVSDPEQVEANKVLSIKQKKEEQPATPEEIDKFFEETKRLIA